MVTIEGRQAQNLETIAWDRAKIWFLQGRDTETPLLDEQLSSDSTYYFRLSEFFHERLSSK